MKNKYLYAAWGVLYVLCAGLGFLGEATGFAKAALVFAAVVFFVPPVLLLVQARKSGDRRPVLLIRILSLSVLVLTTVLIVITFLCATGPALLGGILHVLLILFSCPMLCGQYWALSLFFWACLLFATFRKGTKAR